MLRALCPALLFLFLLRGPTPGLAWAIAEHLADETRCFTLFATHFHELTALALANPAVTNRHVTAIAQPGSDAITMLFEVGPPGLGSKPRQPHRATHTAAANPLPQVRDGACPTSFGIHVAELVGFPAAVLRLAREKAAQLEATSGGARDLIAASAAGGAAAVASPGPGDPSVALLGAKRFATEFASLEGFRGLPVREKRARLQALLVACPM